jgi:hypothetical protein
MGITMLYPELFRQLEQARWNLEREVPWDRFDAGRLSEEQARTIKMNGITEWSALPATEMFLRDNAGDSDFSAFMSVWFYEEQKHALVLMEYLRRFWPDLVPSEEELHAVRFRFDPAPPSETLMLHFCGEIRLTAWYRCAAAWHTEPVIQAIYGFLAGDEARHASCYMRYMRRAIEREGDSARLAFARIGVLMTSRKTGRAMHPTNLHVSQEHYPEDTVQSRLPDPEWMERWLNHQIRFDEAQESRVGESILRKLGNVLGEDFATVHDLRRYRRTLEATARSVGGDRDVEPGPASATASV